MRSDMGVEVITNLIDVLSDGIILKIEYDVIVDDKGLINLQISRNTVSTDTRGQVPKTADKIRKK